MSKYCSSNFQRRRKIQYFDQLTAWCENYAAFCISNNWTGTFGLSLHHHQIKHPLDQKQWGGLQHFQGLFNLHRWEKIDHQHFWEKPFFQILKLSKKSGDWVIFLLTWYFHKADWKRDILTRHYGGLQISFQGKQTVLYIV